MFIIYFIPASFCILDNKGLLSVLGSRREPFNTADGLEIASLSDFGFLGIPEAPTVL